MLRLDIDSTEQLMRLYQVIMMGKFSNESEDLLVDKSMADIADRIVDTLMGEARTAENAIMVEKMEQMRELQTHYPQFNRLVAYFSRYSDWEEITFDHQTTLIRYAAAPLTVSCQLLGDIKNKINAARHESD